MPYVVWTPDHHQAGAAVLGYVWKNRPTGPVTLSCADLFCAVMVGLIEAEQMSYAVQLSAGLAPAPPKESYTGPFPAVVGGQAHWLRSPFDKFGRGPLLAYQAMQGSGRAVVRGSRYTSSAPEFGGTMPAPEYRDDDGQTLRANRIGPLAAVLVGVVAVGALAAGSYISAEYFKSNATVEAEKLRVHAELALKQEVVKAQVLAGQVPQLDQATISRGEAEETRRWLVPATLGVVGAGVGVAVGRAWLRRGK